MEKVWKNIFECLCKAKLDLMVNHRTQGVAEQSSDQEREMARYFCDQPYRHSL